ncbi:hypothetical protein [Actinotalea sp. K2]|uniref:hypothetical protein n=1 Tax=Actinotalea sp. K2 TaxID=2939438 RepID=UPI0020174AB7|nr:hypothetical protein [Actinotalea sp. K2]MCL3863225.1 hypothetical protein [Actinotalea sp. K2]
MGTVRRLVVLLLCLAALVLPIAATAVEPSPTPDVVGASTTPVVVEPSPTPAVVEPSPTPAVVEPSPAPPAVEPSPLPDVVEASPTPVVVEPSPTPAVVEPSPTPAVVEPGPAPDLPLCEWVVPAATDGTLTLDVPAVQAGTPVLGVLTGFGEWPTRFIGGGSGETFISCTPWAPMGAAEAMALESQDAGLFLVGVPVGTAPGAYPISVMFYEGSGTMHDGGTLVRLSTTVTVSADPITLTPGVACQRTGGQAPVGRLIGDDTAPVGGRLTLGLADVPSDTTIYFNEYDQLWFLACLDGRALVVRENISAGTAELEVPPGLAAGTYTLRLWGLLDGNRVWWERVVTVADDARPATPARPTLPATGASWLPAVSLALLFVATGALALRATRRRT